MAEYNGDSTSSGTMFAHELSRNNYSYSPQGQTDQSSHTAENCQNNIKDKSSWISFEDDDNYTSAAAQQPAGYRDHNNFEFLPAVDHIKSRDEGDKEVDKARTTGANHQFKNDDVNAPDVTDPSHRDKHHQDRGQLARVADPAQPDPYYLLSFQEWYKGYNPEVQQGEQPTASWQLPLQNEQKPPKVPNYLILSIIASFFCVFIGGVALSYVLTSKKQRKSGNYQAAIESASTALTLSIVAIVLGIIVIGVSGFMVWYQIQRMNKIVSENT